MKPVIYGCVGIGGYGIEVTDYILKESQKDNSFVCLGAVCDPALADHAKRVEYLRDKGVTVLSSFDELLALPLDAVWLPVPIHLHRPFLEKSLLAGRATLCEKPAAGCVQDIDAMIAARDRSGLPVAVGFQDVYRPDMRQLKRQLMAGMIGQIRSATVTASWPRSDQYYSRNDWAGKLKKGDVWVLDSPANNALAHQIHLVLFLLGEDLFTSAQPVAVEAELYRVNPIENYDTCSLRITTQSGVSVLVMFTHSSQQRIDPRITMKGSQGEAALDVNRELCWSDKDGEHRQPLKWGNCVNGFAQWLRGQHDEPVATLEMARAHTVVVNGVSEASVVRDVPEAFVQTEPVKAGGTVRYIPGIENVFEQCAASNRMLHESGLVQWSAPAGQMDVRSYSRFSGPKVR